MLSEVQLKYAAFDLWMQSENGDNLVDMDKLKRMLPIVLNECVTTTQKDYIVDYFIEKMTVEEIADKYSINKSTVSRTIHRGLERAYKYLRFVSPLFVNVSSNRSCLKNGRRRQA